MSTPTRIARFLSIVCLLTQVILVPPARAEDEENIETKAPASKKENPLSKIAKEKEKDFSEDEEEQEIGEAEKNERKSGIAKLIKKLTKADGTQASIIILTPLDYTTLNFSELAEENIYAAIKRYGTFNIRSVSYTPASLTLEEFRKVVTRYKADVVLLAVLKPTNFDIFLYDIRTPYYIYAHSETLPEEVQYQLEASVVEEYTAVIIRRALYAYMQDQYYELPRTEYTPLLRYEIPRWVASNRSLMNLNREIISNYYGSLGVGATFMKGPRASQSWTSNAVGLRLGRRVWGPLFFEVAGDLFAYNAFSFSARYMFTNKDNPFRLSAGLGVAFTMNAHTISWDPTFSQRPSEMFLVPSGLVSFPIVDVHVMVESKLYFASTGKNIIFSILPGLFIPF